MELSVGVGGGLSVLYFRRGGGLGLGFGVGQALGTLAGQSLGDSFGGPGGYCVRHPVSSTEGIQVMSPSFGVPRLEGACTATDPPKCSLVGEGFLKVLSNQQGNITQPQVLTPRGNPQWGR